MHAQSGIFSFHKNAAYQIYKFCLKTKCWSITLFLVETVMTPPFRGAGGQLGIAPSSGGQRGNREQAPSSEGHLHISKNSSIFIF
jgi:hypothetical protein